MREADLTLAGTPASVPVARRFVADTLAEWGADDLAWAAQLLVTELATNAALHARSGFTVVVSSADDATGCVRIEVRDGSSRAPRLLQYGEDSTTGRGLQLVDDLASSWGVSALPVGKCVWVELTADHSTAGTPDDDDAPLAGADLDALLAGLDTDDDVPQARWAA